MTQQLFHDEAVRVNAGHSPGESVSYGTSITIRSRGSAEAIAVGVEGVRPVLDGVSVIDTGARRDASNLAASFVSMGTLPVPPGDLEAGGPLGGDGGTSFETPDRARGLGSYPGGFGPLLMPPDSNIAASPNGHPEVRGDVRGRWRTWGTTVWLLLRQLARNNLLTSVREAWVLRVPRRANGRVILTRLLRPSSLAVLFGLVAVLVVTLQARRAKDLAYPEKARIQGRPIPVRTARVEQTPIEQVVGGAAVTAPSALAVIRIGPSRGLSINSPSSDIIIKTTHVREGQRVAQGEVLVEIDDTVLRPVVKQREAALEKAQAEREHAEQALLQNKEIRKLDLVKAESDLQSRTASLENAKQQFEAAKKLIRSRQAPALSYFDLSARYALAAFELAEGNQLLQKAKSELTVGPLSDKQQLAMAVNALETAKIELEMARRDLERARICSPIAGFVSKLEAVPGSVVQVNAILMNVVQLDPILVQIDFPQERMDEVVTGQRVEVVLDSLPKETFAGKVIDVLPQANPELRVIPVHVEVVNPENRIKAGLTGYVRLRRAVQATVVPTIAVRKRGNTATVFCVEDGRARLRAIRTGRLLRTGMLEVLDGLTSGEEVVIFDNFYRHAGKVVAHESYLSDNDPVDVDWRKWARRE